MTRFGVEDESDTKDLELLGLLVEAPDLDAFLTEMVRLAVDTIPAAASCGMTLRRDGRPYTVASSDAFAGQIDEIQYGADEGPCLDTLRHGKAVRVDDLARDARWDRYRPHAVAHGVGSSLSLPLVVDGKTAAAMNLYARHANAFTDADAERGRRLAVQCAAALMLSLRQADQTEVQHQLGEAMLSRSIIDQAMGILMAQQRCTAGEAFDLLRQASQHRNRKLRDVASSIITNVSGEPPQPPTAFRA